MSSKNKIARENQVKNWCFTFHNYPEDLTGFDACLTEHGTYWVYGKERCPTTGTPHLQGYIQFKEKLRLAGVKSRLEFPIRWVSANGTAEQNRVYCSKDGEVSSFGTATEKGQRSDLQPLVDLIQAGASKKRIAEEMPIMVVKFARGIETLLSWRLGNRSWKTEVYWLYGPTGTGKSRWASEKAPEAYYKMRGNKWWDMYEGQEDVIVDDYRCDLCTFSDLLCMLDRYPYRIEYKGGSIPFLAKRIYITTPKSIEATWAHRTEEDLAQLTRRIEHIMLFADDPISPIVIK